MALDHVNLEVFSGRIVGLLGPNGSGKTTLIKLANGLLAPTSGEIRINGYRPGIETKRIVSYLPDKEYLNNWMRVGDLVEFFSEFYSDFREQRALEMLTHLNSSTGDKLKKDVYKRQGRGVDHQDSACGLGQRQQNQLQSHDQTILSEQIIEEENELLPE